MKYFLVCLVCLLVVLDTINNFSDAADVSKAMENVTKNCKKKLEKIKSIKEFHDFVDDLKLLASNSQLENFDDNHVKKCFQDKQSLDDLSQLIKEFDKKRACKFTEISKLEEYAKKYLAEKKKPISIKFFSLFGAHLYFVCGLNLLAHIKQADMEAEQLDFIYSMASPTGWNVLINEHVKKSMKFGTSSKSNNVVNRVAKLIPGLNNLGQLNYLDFDHHLAKKNVPDWKGVEKGSHKLENASNAAKVNEFLSKIISSCKNLDQFYYNSILSLAKLNHLGLVTNIEILTQYQDNNATLHKWLAAASFCQLMVRVKNSQKDDQISFEILHDDKLIESRRNLYSYVSELTDEIHPIVLEHSWQVSVPEGRWNHEDYAIFKSDIKEGKVSVAVEQLIQFIRGLEMDYKSSEVQS